MAYLATNNVYLTQANWFISPQTGSDGYDGTASAFSSGNTGPIKTYAELVRRWGTNAPRLRQNTTITFVTSHTDLTDPVYFNPYMENGAWVVIQGTLGASQQVATGSLSNVTVKNRSTPQLLLAQSGATAVNQLVVNTTHPSRAYTYALSSGSIYKMSQPFAPATMPNGNTTLAEVDNWTNGDSVTVYNPVAVNIVQVQPVSSELNAGSTNHVVYIYQLSVYTGVVAFAPLTINASVVFFDCFVNRDVSVVGSGTADQLVAKSYNNVFNLWNQTTYSTSRAFLIGGILKNFPQIGSVNMDGDIIVSGSPSIYANGVLGLVYVETGQLLNITGWCFALQVSGLYSASIIWGPGGLNIGANGRLNYSSGAGQAVATFLLTGGLQLNSGTTALAMDLTGDPAILHPNRALTAANLDATVASGGFAGIATAPGGAAISNGGN